MDSGRLEEAVRVMVKAAELYPEDFQSLTDAAGALRYGSRLVFPIPLYYSDPDVSKSIIGVSLTVTTSGAVSIVLALRIQSMHAIHGLSRQ